MKLIYHHCFKVDQVKKMKSQLDNAKVDKLMALCDQLKARLSDAQTTQLHLTDSIVEQAV
jgi:hypothetical protein